MFFAVRGVFPLFFSCLGPARPPADGEKGDDPERVDIPWWLGRYEAQIRALDTGRWRCSAVRIGGPRQRRGGRVREGTATRRRRPQTPGNYILRPWSRESFLSVELQ